MYAAMSLLMLLLFASFTKTSGFIVQSPRGLISSISKRPRLQNLFCEPQPPKRKIVKYDNVGDPVYEGEDGVSSMKIDGFTATFLVFALIAFNFLVLANADIPQFNFFR